MITHLTQRKILPARTQHPTTQHPTTTQHQRHPILPKIMRRIQTHQIPHVTQQKNN